MAQAIYCRVCNVAYGAELRGKSCPACGEELIHGRIPASKTIRRANATGSTGRAVWDHILKRDPCAYCGDKLHPKAITIDHIQPKALGGSKGSWTNRTASCRPCNADKEHTPLLFFMLEQQGVNLSHLKDADGHWPIPECQEEALMQTAIEEESASASHIDPRRMLAELTSYRGRYGRYAPLPQEEDAPVAAVC